MYLKFLQLVICTFVLISCKGNHPKFTGYVEGENIYLASPFNGVLQGLKVHRGQEVHQGELLFTLDPNPQQITVEQVKEDLDQAKNILLDLQQPKRAPELSAIQAQIEQTNAEITLAKIRVSRFQKLYDKKATDRDTLDSAIAHLKEQQELKAQYEANLALAKLGSREEQVKAQIHQMESIAAKLEQAKWELAQKISYAPANGIIFDTYYRQGEFVAAQQPVLSLLTPENIQIEFFVPLAFLSKVTVGQIITFDCEGCEPANRARISYISPDAEYLPPLVYSRENNAKLVFRIKAHIDKPQLFKPGQPVTVVL